MRPIDTILVCSIVLLNLMIQTTALCEILLVVTEGRSAQGISSGVFLHEIDLDTTLSTGGVLLSDAGWSGSLSFSHDGAQAAGLGHIRTNTSSTEFIPGPFTVGFAPLQLDELSFQEGYDPVAHFWGYDSARNENLLCSVARENNIGYLTCRVGEKVVTIPLAGIPVLAEPAADGASVSIILRNPETGRFLMQRCELGGSRRIGKALPLPEPKDRFGVEARGMKLTRDGRFLYVGFSGYVIGDSDGQRQSWVSVIDPNGSGTVIGSIEIEGTLSGSVNALYEAPDDAVWVVSASPERAYGYATHLRVEDDSVEIGAALTFTGIGSPIAVAVDSRSGLTAFTLGRDLALYDQQFARHKTHRMSDTVGAIHWSQLGILVGIGNQVCRVDPESGDVLNSATFETGMVRRIDRHPNPLQYSAVSRANPSSRWIRSFVFREDRLGIERFALSPPGTRIHVLPNDSESLPTWLMVTPSPSPEYGDTLSINPEMYARNPEPGKVWSLPVEVISVDDAGRATRSQTRYWFRVDPAERQRPSILWVRNPSENPVSVFARSPENRLSGLTTLLSTHPYSYLQDEISQPGEVDLNGFNIIVLTSASAESGIFTRQVLLDYVSRGGTILYLASAQSPTISQSTARWLEELGMQLDTTTLLNGNYALRTSAGLMRHQPTLSVSQGLGIRVTDRNSIMAAVDPEETVAVAVSRSFGLGRVLAFSSASIFENDSLRDIRSLRFVEGLFRIAGDASADREDLDGDGIPDSIEDRNQNGVHDPGETHFANPDTDGDGIFDGIEDRNQNGFVDDIETHPLLADTDDDGIPDAADPMPLPPSGTPYIASITPDNMPAEGSETVLIQGRNFTANTQIWFGDQQSSQLRLLNGSEIVAVVPPKSSEASDALNVELRDDAFTITSRLENGFRYAPRSSVDVTLAAIRQVRVQYGVYQFFATATLPSSPVTINRATVVVDTEPRESIEYLGIVPGAAIAGNREYMQVTVLGQGQLRVTLNVPEGITAGAPLFELQSRVNLLTGSAQRFEFKVIEKDFRTPLGGIVDSASPSTLEYDFRSSAVLPMFLE